MIITNTYKSTLFRAILPSHVSNTCLWLHGKQERSEDIIAKSTLKQKDINAKSILEEIAEHTGTAFLFPDVPDTYYLNQTETFLMEEFLPYAVKEYALPASKENTYIAGISMGGFGSLLLGSHYPQKFNKIFCISGAFIIDDVLIGNPEVVGDVTKTLPHFQNLFGDLPSLAYDVRRNPLLAALSARASDSLPELIISCGTKDLLYKRNIKLYKSLLESGAMIHWYETDGNHNWDCYNPLIKKCCHHF